MLGIEFKIGIGIRLPKIKIKVGDYGLVIRIGLGLI